VLYSDYIGPARLRLNLPEVAPELKRVWHPCSRWWPHQNQIHVASTCWHFLIAWVCGMVLQHREKPIVLNLFCHQISFLGVKIVDRGLCIHISTLISLHTKSIIYLSFELRIDVSKSCSDGRQTEGAGLDWLEASNLYLHVGGLGKMVVGSRTSSRGPRSYQDVWAALFRDALLTTFVEGRRKARLKNTCSLSVWTDSCVRRTVSLCSRHMKKYKIQKNHFALLHGMYVLFSTVQVITDHNDVLFWLLLNSSTTTST